MRAFPSAVSPLWHAALAGMVRPEDEAALDGRDHGLGQTKELAHATPIIRDKTLPDPSTAIETGLSNAAPEGAKSWPGDVTARRVSSLTLSCCCRRVHSPQRRCRIRPPLSSRSVERRALGVEVEARGVTAAGGQLAHADVACIRHEDVAGSIQRNRSGVSQLRGRRREIQARVVTARRRQLAHAVVGVIRRKDIARSVQRNRQENVERRACRCEVEARCVTACRRQLADAAELLFKLPSFAKKTLSIRPAR